MNFLERNKYMAQFRDPDAEARLTKAVAHLSSSLRDIGYALLMRDKNGRSLTADRGQQMDRLAQACQALVEQPPDEREKLIGLFFPKIKPYILLGWEMHSQRPYTVGNQRVALRAPQRPSWFNTQLAHWLQTLVSGLLPYNQDILWIAEHSHSYLLGWGWEQAAAMLLAAAIDANDDQSEKVLNTLFTIARDDHPQAVIGRYLFGALLNCSQPQAWTFVEQMLIAAQRQEGLRQVILESVDLAHPEAFRRIVSLINAQNLVRFNSVIRAVNVWFQLNFDATQTKEVQNALTMLERFLYEPALAERAAKDDDPQVGYIALLARGFADVDIALDQADSLLVEGHPDQRLMAARFMAMTRSPRGNERLVSLLNDADEHIMAVALQQLAHFRQIITLNLFEHVERLIPKLPAKVKELPPRIWPWWKLRLDPHWAGQLLVLAREGQSLQPVLPYLDLLDKSVKCHVIYLLNEAKKTWDEATRQAMLTCLGDRANSVRLAASKGLDGLVLTPDEVGVLEGYLTRKASDLRKSALHLILAQSDEVALDSATRLLAASKIMQRQAGLELLVKLFADERQMTQCRDMAADFRAKMNSLNVTECALLEQIPVGETAVSAPVTLEDGLGLFDNAQRTRPIVPRQLDFQPITPIALHLLTSLDECIVQHQDVEFDITHWNGRVETNILGHLHWSHQFPGFDGEKSREENLERLPLREIWLAWWEEQQRQLAQGDGFDLLRAAVIAHASVAHHHNVSYLPAISPPDNFWRKTHHRVVIQAILDWMIWLWPPSEEAFDFMLAGVEYTFWHLLHSTQHNQYWLTNYWAQSPINSWLVTLTRLMHQFEEVVADRHHIRLWQLLRWRDEPTLVLPQEQDTGLWSKVRDALSTPLTAEKLMHRLLGEEADNYTRMPRNRPSLEVLMAAYVRGAANDHDLLDLLIGASNDSYRKQDPNRQYYSYGYGSGVLGRVSACKPPRRVNTFDFYPAVQTAVAQVRQRIIEVELQRGDLPTPASRPAKQLRYSGGADTLIQLLQAFGKELFVRAYAFDGESKKAVYSHLIRATLPGEEDTPERFAQLAKKAKIGEKRLIETAVYAPQWASHIQATIGWEGLAEAVWWFHGHTKDTSWRVQPEIREAWAAEINEQTPLTGQDLVDGAVDVAWFRRVYAQLGSKRWASLHNAAKYASGSGGHKRAQLFAQAMLGQLEPAPLIQRIKSKRHQDSVRALGLLPLPEASREDTLLARYLVLQEFLRGSKKFGSQRQASEKLAVRIALENLARTAGYTDPLRLEWAMEQHAVADLAQGAVSVTVENVTVSLSIDRLGEPGITIERQLKDGGVKSLKSVPAKLKKQPDIAALTGRKSDIRRQASRSRLSLENAMIRGDWFTGSELEALCRHPVLKPMLQQLVFYQEGGAMGYPVMGGTELEGVGTSITRLSDADRIRIAHPHDFLARDWHLWQQECFRRERIQPFKQVFRELYLVTPVEAEAHDISRRYAGQEVNPKQALALFGQRGWVTHPDEGTRKTFHDEHLTAHVGVLNGILTPAEVGGETIEAVFFTKRGDWRRLPLTAVPPRIFSEVMRDLDLVVSVAHLGGVDPEATQSSIEARGSLVRETADLLKLNNVTIKERHVLVDGQLSSYSIHLGSGIIHQRPGGYVCIVPVHNAQRGRVFLPFVDKDPKTAEIIAKTVMLARDRQIKDPTILEQLVRATI